MEGFCLSARTKSVRHNRVLDIRKKVLDGWTMEELIGYCLKNLDVTKITAISYIDEAAEPYRQKYQEQQLEP
jgi:hypothetical protein